MKKLQDPSFVWATRLKEAEKEYCFQPLLTDKFDNHSGAYTETTILEIVLWKTNRYPTITEEMLTEINDLRKDYSEEKARKLLRLLLQKEIRGFDLPMASSVLRFGMDNIMLMMDND